MFDFGNWLKCVRKDLNMSQAEFADYIGVSLITISNYETHKKFPSYEHLIEYLDMFGYRVEFRRVA